MKKRILSMTLAMVLCATSVYPVYAAPRAEQGETENEQEEKEILAVQNMSVATPIGAAPQLPEYVSVYFADGTSALSKVIWDTYDEGELNTEKIFTVTGTTETGKRPVKVSIRVTGETIQSENYAKKAGTSAYPKAITSYSENGITETLNDGLANKWSDKNNPNAEKKVWLGIVFGGEAPESRYVNSVVLDLLNDSTWDETKIEVCEVEYYNKEISAADVPEKVDHFDAEDMAQHPFNQPENWTSVGNLTQPEVYTYGRNELTFDMVKTPAIRVKTTHGGTYIALQEFCAYGKDAIEKESFTVTGLSVDGATVEDFAPETHEYMIRVAAGTETVPTMELTADNNASVTLLPASAVGADAKFYVTSEDGETTESYTIKVRTCRSALEETIAKVKKYSSDDYTRESYQRLLDAITAAEELLKNTAAEDTALQAAEDALNTAANGLQLLEVDKAKLRILMEAVEEMKLDRYTEESRAALTEAMEAARAVMEKADASKTEILRAEAKLVTVLAGLEEKKTADLSFVGVLKKIYGVYDIAQYTPESAAPFQKAMEAVDAVLTNPAVTQEEVNTAAVNLIEAAGALKLKPAPVPVPDPGAPVLKIGQTFTHNGLNYKVTKAAKGKESVYVTAPSDKNITKAVIPPTVTYQGVVCKVTAISSKAFYKCTNLSRVVVGANVTTIGKMAFYGDMNLKTILVKSKGMKKVGANALKGIYAKALLNVPDHKVTVYSLLFANKGQKATLRIR